jgi:hypothetical protein
VWVGKNREKKIDFVARSHSGEIEYYQAALSVRDKAVLNLIMSLTRHPSAASSGISPC